MKYKFINRHATRGIVSILPLELQGHLWKLITDLQVDKNELDYLQVFELNKKDNTILEIIHRQEYPEFEYKSYVRIDSDVVDKVNDKKIFVIDDVTHSTMLFSDEY